MGPIERELRDLSEAINRDGSQAWVRPGIVGGEGRRLLWGAAARLGLDVIDEYRRGHTADEEVFSEAIEAAFRLQL